MFRKILVANRGEIALRVIRACRELGVDTVAVYSEADEHALHVRAADEAVCIGAAPSSQSYLRGDVVVQAAVDTGAEAVHPGYGFLSEQPWFARAVEDAGLTFIGPSPDAIAAVGSKTAARAIAARCGVPTVPGSDGALASHSDAALLAERFGYPVLLKAAAGGGGKGMRVVSGSHEMEAAFGAAGREAMAAFGSDEVFLEKLVVKPRHVEIQVLADLHGNCIHLLERECSVQRRHQKLVEEAPSPVVDSDLRARMGEMAVRVATAAGYTNAGTVEFLLAPTGEFYFLEINTRLQVEHPVTELITGLDLVEWQLRIACGEHLTVRQEQVIPRGHAIECRITAEDIHAGFLPATGTVTHLSIPSGAGVRWDGALETGSRVGSFYDPMLAKLIVWAEDRSSAIARLSRALDELLIVGVETSRDLHRLLVRDPQFRAGDFDIQWLERVLPQLLDAEQDGKSVRAAAIAAALIQHRRRGAGQAGGMGGRNAERALPTDGWPRDEVTGWGSGTGI